MKNNLTFYLQSAKADLRKLRPLAVYEYGFQCLVSQYFFRLSHMLKIHTLLSTHPLSKPFFLFFFLFIYFILHFLTRT